jgi:glutamate/tyrosine decarboxylase-like PLP-dependent enzyme
VDPLPAIADFCRREDLWFHADAAYGGAALLCPRGHAALAGLALADSLALDPHKWLFQPVDLGCVLVREDRWLVETFRLLPDYLRDAYRVEPELNYCDRGLELTRPLRVLKLWLTLHTFGVAAVRRAVEWGFELAAEAERRLRWGGVWEILTPPSLAILTFRHVGLGEDGQLALIDRLRETGFALLTSTRVGGRNALRLCTINPRTTFEDVRGTIERLEEIARQAGA